MSEYVFRLPDLGEGTVESEIAEWMVQVGDRVDEEDTLCAMLTDKAAVELTAPVSGEVLRLAGDVGDTIAVGEPLVVFAISDEAGERPSASAAAEPPARPAGGTAAGPGAGQAPSPEEAAPTEPADEPERGRVRTSPSIRRRASIWSPISAATAW